MTGRDGNKAVPAVTSAREDGSKEAVRARFDRLAPDRESWQRKASYYYTDQQRYFRFLVPEGLRVLEVGSGLGDLLASLQSVRGMGIDLSEAMVKEAAGRHPHLEFCVADVEALQMDETFDVIILLMSSGTWVMSGPRSNNCSGVW